MGAELLASAVVIVEEEPQFTSLPTGPTAVTGAVGVAEMGPFGATLSTSYEEYVEKYGGFTSTADLTIAAMGYFLNGGTYFWSVRTVHYTDNTDPSTKTSAMASVALPTAAGSTYGSVTSGNTETFALDPGDTLDLSVDGGATETATFDATAASRSGSGGSYPTGFTGGETLLVKIDGGAEQTVTFAGTDSDLVDVIDACNVQLTGCYADYNGGELRITSDTQGSGSGVEVTGGTGAGTLGMSVGSTSGTGDVADISAVTAAEVKSVVETDTTATVTVESSGAFSIKTPTIGSGGSIQVEATSTADGASKFDLDNSVHSGTDAGAGNMGTAYAKYHGAFGNDLEVRVTAATSGDADEFNLYVDEDGVEGVEGFPNLSTVTTSARYWVTVVNSANGGSNLITVEDDLVGVPPANRPTNGTYSLSGGDDGLTSLADTDFIGSSAGPTGLYELDVVENLSLLIVANRATAAVQQAMLTYCETWRKGLVFAILDPPASQSSTEIVTYVKSTASIQQFSEHGAIYWPRIKVQNPDKDVFTGDADGLITVAPAGFLAGVFARTDASRPGGIYDPPAGVEHGIIYGCLGFETDQVLDEKHRDIVYPELINPLTTWPGAPRHIDGTKTLKSTGNFPTVAERRGVSNIERTIRTGLSFARHANNTRKLRRRCHRTTYAYLVGEMEKGAFRTQDPATAFKVDFSDNLNPATVVFAQQLRGRIALATNKPTDYVVLYISQDTRAIDAQLAELQS
jgi:hypothetical protein